MQSSSEGCYNIVELAKQLRREYLFINSERETLQSLNEKVENTSLELSQAAWICAQQRLNLNSLIVSRAESNSIALCQRANHLENASFVDAHKVLKYKDVLSLGELLRWVRETPRLVALCLLLGEGGRGADSIAHSLCAGLYGGCVHPEDRALVLRVLRHLLKHQVAADEDPRKLLRSGTCAFSRLYAVFRDAHAPAALFLSAALRAPLMQLLKEDEFFLDIDPDKALERFTTSDRLKKFGQPNTTEYNAKLARYRKRSIATLSSLAFNFISSLTSHWSCFPPSMGALVRRLAARLASAGVTEREIHMTCTDLVFTHFVCPAIVNPEAYGIIDIPVSYVARYNLIQVAQIIQMLCLAKYQPPETKARDLYSRFNKECVSSLLETIILDPDYSTCETDLPTLDEDGGLRTEPSVETYVAMFTRGELRMLISYLQRISLYLNNNTPPNPTERPHPEEAGPSNVYPTGLIFDGRSGDSRDQGGSTNDQSANTSNDAASHSNRASDHDGCSTPINQQNGDLDSTRSNYSDGRPNGDVFPIDGKSNETFSSSGSDEGSSTSSNSDSSRFNGSDAVGVSALVQSLEPNFKSRLHDLLKRLPDLTDIRRASSTASESHSSHSSPSHEPSTSKRSLLAKVPKPRIPRSGSMASALASFTGDSAHGSSRDDARSGDGGKDRKKMEVLMFKLPGDNGPEYVGLLPESKVLEQYYASLEGSVEAAAVDILLPADQEIVVDVVPDVSDVGHTKRTRFSVKCPSSHDEVSIGNTSDGLEAVSEAASNHSVTSSLELETEDQNDNLSDMVSANVSGRGSPNISGRDTPSSQVTEGEGGLQGDVGVPPPPPARLAASVYQQQSAASKQAKLLKQARNEIVDKFCKFEIKKLLEGDETISIISDTWSTDVLASDSETIGDSCERNYLLPTLQGVNAASVNAGVGPAAPSQPDVSETASESAWSIDVLASDSDRMTEVDTDDCVSVAARSDTSSLTRGPSRRQSAASGDFTPVLRPIAVGPPVVPSQQHDASPGVRRAAESMVMSPRTSARARNMPPNVLACNLSPVLPSGSSSNPAQSSEVYQHFQPVTVQNLDERKSILVNGYPVMMCYGPLVPDSPQSPERGRPPLPPSLFDFPQPPTQASQDPSPARTVDTVPSSPSSADLPIRNGYSTNQWVNNAHNRFPPPSSDSSHSTFRPIKNEQEEFDDVSSTNRDTDTMDRSLNSSESSFNASSSSHCDHNPTFEPVPGPSGLNGDTQRSAISDLMTRMSSATISTSTNLVNNIASRLVKTSEMRTSIISISSSRVEKMQNGKRGDNSGADVSLSTLSVNSVDTTSTSERSSSQDVVSENVVTERRVSPPSLDGVRNGIARTSTDKAGPLGAMPKSISFDSTAEKTQRHGSGDRSQEGEGRSQGARRAGANFFNKIKMFRHRSGRGSHGHTSHEKRLENQDIMEGRVSGDVSDEAMAGRSDDVPKLSEPNESTDDILAKYRRKASTGSGESRGSRNSTSRLSEDVDRSTTGQPLVAEGSIELNNAEMFASVKHKLRHVLANADLHCMDYAPSHKTCTELTSYLRLVSACESEASAVHAGEALRCVRACGEAGARRLLAALRADAAARRPYTAYLARSRRGLLSTLARLDRQVSRVRAESSRSCRAAAAARCLQQLERGASLRRLARQLSTTIQHSLSAGDADMTAPVDERAARLAAAMRALSAEIKSCASWESASQTQLDAVDAAVERAAFAQIYLHAMFPNGDGDIARDHVLCEHIRRLSSYVSAASVGVAARHVPAAPFPAAQSQLAALPVYRTPRDKVRCVVGCVTTIMAVLSMSEGSAASADDLTPVLVYVIIKVNPPSLLSTIQFVQNFHPGALQGEEHYWWTQFCSAVAYIKTMEYRRPNP